MRKNILKSKWICAFVILLLLFPFQVHSVNNELENSGEKTVTLVVSGEGTTKEEATSTALRSAIEQAYGTFVSANTDILNDDIIKDEIATVSSGNIQSYKELSTIDLGQTKVVNIEAVVSVGQLVSYAKSKGMNVELAGATFALNMKMRELNNKNELIAIDNMFKQLNMMSENTNFFDYKLSTGEPYKTNNGRYAIQVIIELLPNKNAVEFYSLFMKTISSLALTDKEIEEYRSANLEVYEYNTYFLKEIGGPERCYLRNELLAKRRYASYVPWLLGCLAYPVLKSMSKFEIVDNLQNRISIGLINQRNLLDKYRTDIELDRVGYYGEREINKIKLIYSMIGVSQGEGFNHKSLESYSLGHDSSLDHYDIIRMEDIGKVYQKTRGGYFRPFQLTTTLLYSPESFMKLSSVGIVPTSGINFFE